jgi:hypothetical protein
MAGFGEQNTIRDLNPQARYTGDNMNNNYLPPKGSVSPAAPAPNVPAATQDWRAALDRARSLNQNMPRPPQVGGNPLPVGGGMPPMAGGNPGAQAAGPGPNPNAGAAPAGMPSPQGGGLPPMGSQGQQIGGVANALRNRREMLGY